METTKVPVTDRIKTVDDAIQAIGIEDKDVKAYRVLLNELGDNHHLTCYAALVVVAKALNEGWTPDWSNGKWDKWFPWFHMGGSSGFRSNGCVIWRSTSRVGSRLCFKSSELANYAGQQFVEVYKQFMLIP